MRLRTWLLLSYLIVMILPLVMAYMLFAWINSINSEQKVQEHFDVYLESQKVTSILDDPFLYRVDANFDKVDQIVNDHISVSLYNQDGLTLYESISKPSISNYVNKKLLLQGLYSLEQGYRVFTYKEPVYKKNEIIGFFEIEFSRNEWMTSVTNRSLIVIGVFIGSFLLIYLVVVLFVNRKLNVRITGLMSEMSAFARGETLEETETGRDEIGQLKEHFYSMRKKVNLANEAIAKEQETKAYMIAAISHDLKTPLTSIKAYAEMLETQKDMEEKEQQSYRHVIVEKADFMQQMLDDLLTYTLLQSPTYDPKLVVVEGEEFFEMLVSDYDGLCKEKGVQLNVSAHVTGEYELNPKQMMRVADNLMSNAIQHTDKGRDIWIGAHANGKNKLKWLFPFVHEQVNFNFKENVYFIVQNEGQGIEEEKLKYIFDPLYQADQARSKKDEHGTGLGLSITKQIMEKHGGTVSLYSEEHVGTCIICCLPKTIKGDVTHGDAGT